MLNDISLTIPARKTVAFVGENGAGKTTLIKLLCRLYNPVSGAISIDGTDISQVDTSDLWKRISVIFQDYVLYNTTAGENIWGSSSLTFGYAQYKFSGLTQNKRLIKLLKY